MRKVHLVLRLFFAANMGIRTIARAVEASPSTIAMNAAGNSTALRPRYQKRRATKTQGCRVSCARQAAPG